MARPKAKDLSSNSLALTVFMTMAMFEALSPWTRTVAMASLGLVSVRHNSLLLLSSSSRVLAVNILDSILNSTWEIKWKFGRVLVANI